MPKKILIDGRFIGVGDSISRVTLGILAHLLEIDKNHQYFLLIRPAGIKLVKEYGFWEKDNLTVKILDIPHYSFEEQTKLLIWLNKRPFDLVFFTQFNHPVMYKRPYIVVIHDMTTFGYFHYQNPLKVAMFKKVMKSAVFESKKIITISEASKKEIVDYYEVAKSKIKVAHLGIDENYLRISKLDAGARRRLGQKFKNEFRIENDYLLYTGMWKKHKNLKRLLQAFEKVSDQLSVVGSKNYKLQTTNLQLVLIGKIDRNEREIIEEIERINGHEIDKIQNEDPVFVTGFLAEELLPAAYAGALAYVTPSLNEGFGLPPLEAMACGAPVVAANISATPEILGKAAEYFDPYNVADIAEKIIEVISNFHLRLDLQKKGFERVKKYFWEKCAKETLGVINEVIGSK